MQKCINLSSWFILCVWNRKHHFSTLRPSDAYMRQQTNHHWSDNGLSPRRPQAIIWIFFIRILGTTFSEILSEFHIFSSFKNVLCKMMAILSRSQCVNATTVNANRYTYNNRAMFPLLWSWTWQYHRCCELGLVICRLSFGDGFIIWYR